MPDIIDALIVAIGAFAGVAYGQWAQHRREAEMRALESALDFVGRQLSELYAPLYFEVMRYDHSLEYYRRRTNKRGFAGINEGELSDEEAGDWYHWVVDVALPILNRIDHLLSTRADLLEGATLPDSFDAFRGHHFAWQFNCARKGTLEAGDVAEIKDLYTRLGRFPWPSRFTSDVKSTYEELKKRQGAYLDDRSLPQRVRALHPRG